MADKEKNNIYDVRKKWMDSSQGGGYPVGEGRMIRPNDHSLQPSDHFRTDELGNPTGVYNGYLGGGDLNPEGEPFVPNEVSRQLDDASYIVKNKSEHFIRDLNDTQMEDPYASERPVLVPNSDITPENMRGNKVVFSGSTTNVNPTNDPEMQRIIDYGLSDTEEEHVKDYGDYKPPLSVMHPFTRMIDIKHPNDQQISNLTSFNRYHLPVADLEHRKAFRHLFFTRPECYICCTENGKSKLSQQAEFDEDFNTSFSRMPYISKLLSPVYVTGSFGQSTLERDNFNYLLSNRCLGLTPSGGTLSVQDTIGKSIQGYTVTPGMFYEGRQGSVITVSFRDTKYLEVYECIRMWMLYIWKLKYGVFAPSFNGYKYLNGFPDTSNGSLKVSANKHLHPFDRALDYTISMFDYVMDESDSMVRYWCKYYGMYPIDVQIEGLSNGNNDALKNEMIVSVQFKYSYKIENTIKTLVEFNYNAGVCDNVGKLTSDGSKNLEYSEQFVYKQNQSGVLKDYVGPGAGFVGTPYVVLMSINKDIMKDTSSGTTTTPCLRFSPITYDYKLNQRINMGIENKVENDKFVVQSELSQT